MKIRINGEDAIVSCTTLGELLESLDHEPDSVATAVNQEFVAIDQRAHCKLDNEDTIDIIAPMSGG